MLISMFLLKESTALLTLNDFFYAIINMQFSLFLIKFLNRAIQRTLDIQFISDTIWHMLN